MHNNEYHMWEEHIDHDIKVTLHEWTNHKEIILGCTDCGHIVEVWEFIPEYEENYEEA